jgi:hypothetical protein
MSLSSPAGSFGSVSTASRSSQPSIDMSALSVAAVSELEFT